MISGYDDDCLSIFLSECHTTVRFEFKSKNPHKNPLMGKCTWNTSAQETDRRFPEDRLARTLGTARDLVFKKNGSRFVLARVFL